MFYDCDTILSYTFGETSHILDDSKNENVAKEHITNPIIYCMPYALHHPVPNCSYYHRRYVLVLQCNLCKHGVLARVGTPQDLLVYIQYLVLLRSIFGATYRYNCLQKILFPELFVLWFVVRELVQQLFINVSHLLRLAVALSNVGVDHPTERCGPGFSCSAQ